MNRCVECGRFRPWEDLHMTRFVPLNEFGPEEIEFTCTSCIVFAPVAAPPPKGSTVTGNGCSSHPGSPN